MELGSSRIMQICDWFFTDPEQFYNAGGTARYPAEMQCFLEQIPDKSNLKCVIISIDQWGFNSNYTGELKYPDTASFADLSLNQTLDFKNAATQLIDDYIKQKLSIKQLLVNRDRIGVNAKVNKEGFLNDGSYYYGRRFSQKNDPDEGYFADTFQRIENGNNRFEYEVIGFESPFAVSVVKRLEERGNDYRYMADIPRRMSEVFDKYQFEFYDYSDVSELGCGADSFFIDGFHGSDAVYIKMFENMIERGSCLEKYCDINELIKLYAGRDSNVAIYELFIEF